MRIPLKTRVSLFITIAILGISSIGTAVFTTILRRIAEKEIVARGTALSYSLARAAREGLVAENLDLLQKAAHIVHAEDIKFAQVYSSIWSPVDAYPFEEMHELPSREAIRHFKQGMAPFSQRIDTRYDFYNPIIFTVSQSPPVTIGFARLSLSTASLRDSIRLVVLASLLGSALITILFVVTTHILIGRLVVGPVMNLHRAVALFKNGHITDAVTPQAADEIAELSLEFNTMSQAIQDRERRLVESEKRIKNLFARVEHAIFRLDADGAILETNKKFEELCGVVKQFCALFGETEAAENRGLCLSRKARDGVTQSEERIMGAAGNDLVVLLSLYPEFDAAGVLRGFDGYFIDITARTRMEESLRQAYQALERQNLELKKLDTMKDSLIRDVTHELKTPVAKHAMQLEMLRSFLGEDCRRNVEHTLQAMERSIRRQEQVISNLLNLSHLESGGKKLSIDALRLDEIIGEVVEDYRFFFEISAIDLKIDCAPVTVLGDREMLWHVFSNLMNNALKFLPKDQKGRISIAARTERARAIVRFTDNGIGLTTEERARAFEKFFQGTAAAEGAGVGLCICKKIVEELGGEIGLESAGRGQGATAIVSLPLATPLLI